MSTTCCKETTIHFAGKTERSHRLSREELFILVAHKIPLNCDEEGIELLKSTSKQAEETVARASPQLLKALYNKRPQDLRDRLLGNILRSLRVHSISELTPLRQLIAHLQLDIITMAYLYAAHQQNKGDKDNRRGNLTVTSSAGSTLISELDQEQSLDSDMENGMLKGQSSFTLLQMLSPRKSTGRSDIH